jgi:hypothetical protein
MMSPFQRFITISSSGLNGPIPPRMSKVRAIDGHRTYAFNKFAQKLHSGLISAIFRLTNSYL